MRPFRPMLLLPAGLLTLQCLLFHTATAQQLAESNAPDRIAPAQDEINNAARAQALVDRDAWQRAIAELEARDGSWGAELGEAWLGLGTTLRALDQHEAAAEAFGKALQSLRIGYGLNDVRQLPVLEQLRAAHAQTANWDEVNAANHLMFQVAKHSGDEKLRVEALLELGRWMQRAYAEQLVSDNDVSPGRLTELYSSEIQRLDELETDYAGKSLHFAALHLGLAANELGEAKRKFELPITEFQSPASSEQRSVMSQQCATAIDRNGRPVTLCTTPMEVPNLNYYLGPNVQKNTEIREHLATVQNSAIAAFRTLQGTTDSSAQRSDLQAEMLRLTTEYNEFVKLHPNGTPGIRRP